MARPDFDTLDLPPDPPSRGESVTVFYDVEFTELSPVSELLSIGLVAADSDAELYIEIADADVRASSDFVKEIVLPLFGQHNPEVLPRASAATRIENWLDSVRTSDGPDHSQGIRCRQLQMVSDSQWDWEHFVELFPVRSSREPTWATEFNLVGRMVQHFLDLNGAHRSFSEEVAAYHRQHGEQHHALVDARALKAGWMAVKKPSQEP